MKILFVLQLIASTAFAFSTLPISPRQSTTLRLYDNVEAAIADAQRICAPDPSSPACRVAWDIVEELEAANSHKGGPAPVNQQAPDYAVFMGSFDILIKKIDGKMDQLKATTDKLEELGITDPYVAELGEVAEQMKQALRNARAVL